MSQKGMEVVESDKDTLSSKEAEASFSNEEPDTNDESSKYWKIPRQLLSKMGVRQRAKELMEKKRRILFTDAAVAIALTLLILPLMDAAIEAQEEEEDITTREWFQANKDLLLTFFISYMVIAMEWTDHDCVFRYVAKFTKLLSCLNFVWLMAIAFLPVATNVMNSVADNPLQHFIWIGTMLFGKIVTFTMLLVVHNEPKTWEPCNGPQYPQFVSSIVSIVLLIMALLLSITRAGYWMMLIAILRAPIAGIILWKWPSLETKWAASDEKKNEQMTNSEITTESISDDLMSDIQYLLAFRDRIVGLVDAERLIGFTDAAAAIALTLLVLPLMDAATAARGIDLTTVEYFQENRKLMLSFFLSFLVTALLWSDQDSLFRKVACFTKLLSTLNFLWLLSIVFIPVATAIINLGKGDPLQHIVYIGTLLLAKILTFFMTIEVHRNPGTWARDGGGPDFSLLLRNIVTIILLVIVLVLSVTTAGYLVLLILVLSRPIVKLIIWKWPSLKTRW